MNSHPVLDEVDDYVEALLGGGLDAPAATMPAGPASANASEATTQAIPETVAPAVPIGAETGALASASAAAISAAPIQPLATTPPTRARFTPASHRWLRVTLGNGSYALELLCVQEVVRVAPIVAMRGASRAVLGVMNLRGRIVPVFDLGLWLGTACVVPDERSRIVVVERDDELIGVLVTLVEDVVTLTQSRIEPPLPGSTPGAVVGVARVGPVPTVLMDAGALFG